MTEPKPTPTFEELKNDPVLFVETYGWHPEPGYVPPWQKKLLEDLCSERGRV